MELILKPNKWKPEHKLTPMSNCILIIKQYIPLTVNLQSYSDSNQIPTVGHPDNNCSRQLKKLKLETTI
jgi:hypothetical protein